MSKQMASTSTPTSFSSMASASNSTRRDRDPETQQHSDSSESKKARIGDATDSDSPNLQPPKKRVVLNPADCNLDFNIDDDGLKGSALHEAGFAYCWSGARANIGITGGKYCFSCKVISTQPVNMGDTLPDRQHACLVGISRGECPVENLGETHNSYAAGGIGNFSKDGDFLDCGQKFGFTFEVGDTILCAVNLERKRIGTVRFYKNGKCSGYARIFESGPTDFRVLNFPKNESQWKSAFFPHVLLKNVVVQFQFSVADGLVPVYGYKPWDSALDDGDAIMGPVLSDTRDCEVMMMVGLPASGKSMWAEAWVQEHPEKRYMLLGTNHVLDQMKVPFTHNYGEDYDRYISRANAMADVLNIQGG